MARPGAITLSRSVFHSSGLKVDLSAIVVSVFYELVIGIVVP
jgi:hypothetical protein